MVFVELSPTVLQTNSYQTPDKCWKTKIGVPHFQRVKPFQLYNTARLENRFRWPLPRWRHRTRAERGFQAVRPGSLFPHVQLRGPSVAEQKKRAQLQQKVGPCLDAPLEVRIKGFLGSVDYNYNIPSFVSEGEISYIYTIDPDFQQNIQAGWVKIITSIPSK